MATIDGKPVRDDVAAAFRPMADAFAAATGCSLHVRDGLRSLADQQKAWDTYQRVGYPVAAYPNPNAPHVRGAALDLFDSGADNGVTTFGTARNAWLDSNCGQFGFSHTGNGFDEPWHYEFVGVPSAPAPAVSDAGGAVPGVIGPNPFGIPYSGGLQKIARLYGYTGELDQDWGDGVNSGSMRGFVQFLRANWGYSGNTELGPVMWGAIARWLRATEGYVGNDVPGPIMRAALLRRDTANWNEL
jgi:hypothetical protein